uniref:Uncharacterized protein n=1 Tax=viral metagenome TaxID=1070528 RepID=A0A6C0J8H1_9ZZZZ
MSFSILSKIQGTEVVPINCAPVWRLLDVLLDVNDEWLQSVTELKSSLTEEEMNLNGQGYIVPSMLDTENTLIYCIKTTLQKSNILSSK